MQRLKPLNDFIFGKTFGEKGDDGNYLENQERVCLYGVSRDRTQTG